MGVGSFMHRYSPIDTQHAHADTHARAHTQDNRADGGAKRLVWGQKMILSCLQEHVWVLSICWEYCILAIIHQLVNVNGHASFMLDIAAVVFIMIRQALWWNVTGASVSLFFHLGKVPPPHRVIEHKFTASCLEILHKLRLCNNTVVQVSQEGRPQLFLNQSFWCRLSAHLFCVYGVQEYGKLNIPSSDTCTSTAKIAVLYLLCLELIQLVSEVNLQGPVLRTFKAT